MRAATSAMLIMCFLLLGARLPQSILTSQGRVDQRYSWISCMEIAPSPTAEATRLTDPCLTPGAAKTWRVLRLLVFAVVHPNRHLTPCNGPTGGCTGHFFDDLMPEQWQ